MDCRFVCFCCGQKPPETSFIPGNAEFRQLVDTGSDSRTFAAASNPTVPKFCLPRVSWAFSSTACRSGVHFNLGFASVERISPESPAAFPPCRNRTLSGVIGILEEGSQPHVEADWTLTAGKRWIVLAPYLHFMESMTLCGLGRTTCVSLDLSLGWLCRFSGPDERNNKSHFSSIIWIGWSVGRSIISENYLPVPVAYWTTSDKDLKKEMTTE